MGIRFLSAHTVQDGDTIDSLVIRYRLSSSRAIAECPANVSILSKLPDRSRLPAGLVLSIPPSVFDLARDRIYALNRLKPACLAHFDKLQVSADTELQQAVLTAEALIESRVVRQILSALRMEVGKAIADIAEQALPLVPICKGMALTHAAQPTDHAATESATDPQCGLYWAVSPDMLALWRGMWEQDLWMAKWHNLERRSAWEAARQYLNTVRSLVAQQIDQRIRDALSLQRQLQAETGD